MDGSPTEISAGGQADRAFRFDTASYERLLRRIRDAGRTFVGHDEPEAGVVLHHDVALSLDRALAVARLEATLRIEGTYCVSLDAPVHDTSTVTFAHAVQTIAQLGHEVGLRFDPRAHWEEPPSETALRKRIDDRRAVLGRLIDEPVSVVSFHRPTERCRSLELEGAVNARRQPEVRPGYDRVSDWTWQSSVPFPEGIPERFQLAIHPGLWHPVDRPSTEVLADYRRAAHEAVDAYFDAIEPSQSAD